MSRYRESNQVCEQIITISIRKIYTPSSTTYKHSKLQLTWNNLPVIEYYLPMKYATLPGQLERAKNRR